MSDSDPVHTYVCPHCGRVHQTNHYSGPEMLMCGNLCVDPKTHRFVHPVYQREKTQVRVG